MLSDGAQLWQIPIGSDGGPRAGLRAAVVAAALVGVRAAGVVVDRRVVGRRAELPDREGPAASRARSWRCWTATGRSTRWRSVPARVDTGATVEMRVESGSRRSASDRPPRATWAWCARSTRTHSSNGRRSASWAVADGLGGHRDGEVASRMVCDALAELVPDPTFDGTIEAARQRLQSVNDYLLRTGTHATLADRSASTVVVLLVRGAQLRHSLGGRQPGLSVASRQAGALDPRPQPGGLAGTWWPRNVQCHHASGRRPADPGARPASRQGDGRAIDFCSARTG